MPATKRPIRRITFDDVLGKSRKKALPTMKLGRNEFTTKATEDSLTIGIRVEFPDAMDGELRQDLLQACKLLKEAEKFVVTRRKFFDAHVRERLQSELPTEDGLLNAILVLNRRRNFDWKQRSIEMHAKLLRAKAALDEKNGGLSKKEALDQAMVAAEKEYEALEPTEYTPSVKVRG